jgi:hypothetical protein
MVTNLYQVNSLAGYFPGKLLVGANLINWRFSPFVSLPLSTRGGGESVVVG